jgi:tRNA pseudouridine38-40 synthase
MRHIALLVSYDGAAFCGSQRQKNGRTVQGEIERGLNGLFKAPITLSLAGRTDAHVHATGQVAKFSTENQSIPVERLHNALNTHLDKAVRIRKAWEVDSDFHPRFSAKSRTYIYRIEIAAIGNPLLYSIATPMRDLDIDAMREACEPFIGRQDFAAWQSAGSPTPTTIREVKRLEIREVQAFGSTLIEIEIEADAFLYQMVRNIVGALIVAGRGQLTKFDIAALTAGGDRTKCPPPAPPQGLCLVNVSYEPQP